MRSRGRSGVQPLRDGSRADAGFRPVRREARAKGEDVVFLPRAHSLEAFGEDGMLVAGAPGDNPAIPQAPLMGRRLVRTPDWRPLGDSNRCFRRERPMS